MKEEIKKKKLQRKKWRIIVLSIIVIFLIVLIAPPALNKIVENKVKEKLEQLAPVATVGFSSIHANFFASSLSIKDLSIRFQPVTSDSTHHHSLNFSKADFTGINFLGVILNKKLLINKLKLEKGSINLDLFLLDKKDSFPNLLSRMLFKNISIDHFETDETNVWNHTGMENKLLLRGRINIDDININNSSQSSFHFNTVQCNLTNVDYTIPSSNQTVQIRQLLLDSRSGMLRIDSLKITPEKASDPKIAEAFISSIRVSKLDVLKLEDKKLIAGTIVINKSNAHIFNCKSIQKKSKDESSVDVDLNQPFSEVSIDSLVIDHSSLNFESAFANNLGTKKKDFDMMHLKNFSIRHFLIKEATVKVTSKNSNRLTIDEIEIANLNKSINSSFNWSSLKCNISDINYSIPAAYRTVQINKLIADSKKKLLRVDHLKISTQYSKFQYGRMLGRQADYIKATVPRIEISDLDFKQLLQKKVVADKIEIDESKIYFFRDRRLPRQLKEQPMPNGYLDKIPIEVRVNTLKINNASILSEEFPKSGNESGYLTINNANISMSPLLNHPGKNDPAYSNTHVEGSIMNAGLIEATIHAPLTKNTYFIRGAIKNMDLPKLNPSAENLGKFHIESGVLNFLEFHFTATKEKATGEIIGEYHNLIIDRLKEKNGETKVAKMPTFLLKHLIIPKNKDKSLNVKKRTGKIDYKRDPTRVVTFYFLKSLLSGIRASFTLGFLLPE